MLLGHVRKWQRLAKQLRGVRSEDFFDTVCGMKRFIPLALTLPLLACGGGDGDGSSWSSLTKRVGAKYKSCDILSEGQFGPSTGFPDEGPGAEELCEANCIISASCEQLVDGICRDIISVELQVCLDSCEDLAPVFTCVNGEQIPAEWECDGGADCEDGSDEVGCPEPVVFECASGDETVPESFACDGGEDCEDGSDEVGCPAPVVFECADGQTVPAGYQCDSDPDCEDGSDETGCAEFTCDE